MRQMEIILVVAAAVLAALLPLISGHGYLASPPSRSSMWRYGFNTPANYDDNQLFCGGFANQYGVNGGKCGICGDPYQGPRDNEAGGKYATGTIAEHYTEGQKITVKVKVTANHGGSFEFRVCPNNNSRKPATENCLNQNLLRRPDGSSSFTIQSSEGSKTYSIDLVLPRGLTCTQCVLQWKWKTASSWGCENGNCCKGCGDQEHFMGCADVAIAPGSGVYVNTNAGQLSPSGGGFRPIVSQTDISNHFPSNSGCRATLAWRAVYSMADQWCQMNCPSHCLSQCEDSCRRGSNSVNSVCNATSLLKGMFHDPDNWCKTNCRKGNCPMAYCTQGCRLLKLPTLRFLF